MTHRTFRLPRILGMPVAPLATTAQPPAKAPRVGVLLFSRPDTPQTQSAAEAFRRGLHELGYVEGQNLAIDWRYADGRPEGLPALAADRAQREVHVLVTHGPTIRPAQQAAPTIPIVMAVVTDPVANGLVASLARPGGNLTGVSIGAAELGGKRLELLTQVVPWAARVAVLWNATLADKVPEWQGAQTAAWALGVTLHSLEVRTPEDFDGVLAALAQERPDALITLDDVLTLAHHRRIVAFATQHRLPMISEVRDFAEAVANGVPAPRPPGGDHPSRRPVVPGRSVRAGRIGHRQPLARAAPAHRHPPPSTRKGPAPLRRVGR